MKLKSIITKLSEIVNEKLSSSATIIIIILIATLFFMIGWIFCNLEEIESLEIESPPRHLDNPNY